MKAKTPDVESNIKTKMENTTNQDQTTYLNLLNSTKYLTIASYSQNTTEPQATMMQFVTKENPNNPNNPLIYFKSLLRYETSQEGSARNYFKSSRKNQNLKQNQNVGISILNETKNDYAQIQTTAKLIENQDQLTNIKQLFKEKFPNINLEYLNHKDIEFFQATPYWIKLRTKATFPFEFKTILEKN